MKAIIAKILALFGGKVMQKIVRCIPALVKNAEKAMADGKITAEERKQFVIDGIDIIATEFGYKVTGILRWCLMVIIDNIAKRLSPKDIDIPTVVTEVLKNYA
jgi:hypothetical protein